MVAMPVGGGLFGASAPKVDNGSSFLSDGVFNNWNNGINAGINGLSLLGPTGLGAGAGFLKGLYQAINGGDTSNTNGMSLGARALYGPGLGEHAASWLANLFSGPGAPMNTPGAQVMGSAAQGPGSVSGLYGNFAANGAAAGAGNPYGGLFGSVGGVSGPSLPSSVEGGTMGSGSGGFFDGILGALGLGGDASQASKGGF